MKIAVAHSPTNYPAMVCPVVPSGTSTWYPLSLPASVLKPVLTLTVSTTSVPGYPNVR